MFLSLVFILLVSFVGAMLESASIQNAKNYRRADMNRAVECVFAEYQKELFDQYGIFALEGSYETGRYSEDQVKDRLRFYGATGMEQTIAKIQMLTDDQGAAFREQILLLMENQYGIDRVKSMLGETDTWKSQSKKGTEYDRDSGRKEQELDDLLDENDGALPSDGNPIAHVEALKSSPILELVMPEGTQVSQKQIALSEAVSHRELNRGYGDFQDQSRDQGAMDNLLFGEYILKQFASAEGGKDMEMNQGALDYELEYILTGKESDRENLEAVVKKLLLLRFAPNYAYIQTDAGMKAEAEAMAGALCVVLAVPAITEAAAQMILLAWAYGESVMDLRSLLADRRVPLVKTKESWQLSLAGLMTLGTSEDSGGSADFTEGMKYREYLRILLFLEDQGRLTMRVMDLVEQNMRVEHGLDFFYLDACISRIELQTVCKLRRGITYRFSTYYGYH